MSEENKTILNSSGDDTDNKGAASSTGTDTLSKVNEFNFLKQMVSLEEKMKTFYVNFNKLQDNKGSGTFLRSNVTSVRESVNQALRNGIAFKNDVLDEYQSLKMMPKKLVAETALLQSALFIKLCKHQPMTIVTISTFAVMLPSTCEFGCYSYICVYGVCITYVYFYCSN